MMDAALGAIGHRLQVTTAPTLETTVAVFGNDVDSPN